MREKKMRNKKLRKKQKRTEKMRIFITFDFKKKHKYK